MTAPLFELGWRGGATAARLHRRRPGGCALPWGSVDLATIAPAEAVEARRIWSAGVFTEYASAAAFSALTIALLECGAPVDLSAMAADIVVDELFHVELCSRLTMELGGGVPIAFDLATIAPVASPDARPLLRAAEIAVATSCVSEALSVPAMARSRALATHPLVRAVLARLLVDEGPHARLGDWFLAWAAPQLLPAERDQLAQLAADTIEVYAPLWQDAPCGGCPIPRGLGGHDDAGRSALRATVLRGIVLPLSHHGIVLDPARVAALAAA